MKKLNFAILGCGRVSEYHARIIKKINFQIYLLFVIRKFQKPKHLEIDLG